MITFKLFTNYYKPSKYLIGGTLKFTTFKPVLQTQSTTIDDEDDDEKKSLNKLLNTPISFDHFWNYYLFNDFV